MNRFVASLCLSAAFIAPAYAQHWTYEGHGGPAHWQDLNPDWEVCASGQQQSPIDLTQGVSAEIAMPSIHWNDQVAATVSDNGHTIQASVMNAGGMTLAGVEYELLQFHFHADSEHTIDGRHSAMEVHFVHAAANGDLAVIGVMVDQGSSHSQLSNVFGAMPGHAHGGPGIAARVNLAAFLPQDRTAFRYQGSLTTPPCSEVVAWTVFTSSTTATRDQIALFADRHPDSYRPVQSMARRYLLIGGD